jgi:hypothetical protein
MNMTYQELMQLLKSNPSLRVRPDEMAKLHEIEESEKKHKYNAKPGYLDGIYFDSQAEMERYAELKLLKTARAIKDFRVHPRYQISMGRYYEADFEVIYPDGHVEVEDVKGYETPEFKLKADLFREKYPDLILKIIKNQEGSQWEGVRTCSRNRKKRKPNTGTFRMT